ncbi:LPD38 domain-containing protein [Parabacteroides merdae]|uniref:LPD38 domain-containing protein n=1 Tax=Parabacteroides merdae TaxID=46503 RepID=UPI001897F84D|nr:LPD38 domain-containing protein [Parabacteroides merdae]
MPIFENKGVKYDVSPEYIPDFASEYPDAVTVIERPDKPYRVKASQYDIFMQQHPEPDISIDEMRDTGSFVGDLGERFASGLGHLAGSTLNLMDKGTKALEKIGIPRSGTFGAEAEKLNEWADKLHKASDRYKGKGFSSLWSDGDYSGAMGSALLSATESAPTSLAIAGSTALTGGMAPGLIGAGAITASDKYDELGAQNPELSEVNKWINAIGSGASESLTEVLGAGMIGKTIGNLLKKNGRVAAANVIKKNFLDKMAAFESKHWITAPIASEGMEEMANALAEYLIDKKTGVERTDNIFETMLDAGVTGSMGGAQFVPVIGGSKLYDSKRKKNITNNYKASSETAKRILGEDMDKFNEVVLKHSQSLGSVQDFVDKVASVKGLSSEDLADIRKYTISLLNYNGYVDYVQSRIDEETRRRMDDIGRTANKDMGQVVTVKFPSSDQPVYITGGNIVFDEEGLVDAKQSDDILYYLDENGKVQQGRPEMFDSLIEQYPVEQLYADIINTVPDEVIAQEEMESEAADIQPVMFNPGDLVNLVDGRQGIVQQMSDDGGVIVEVDGMTEEIGLDSVIDNMSKNQTQNEDSSTDGDSKVLENVPEKTLESVVASLPKRNDGTIDYKAMTPQQQYEYTSLSESPQTALEDLRADIENKRSEVSKSESRIEKASGGERASLRDEIRVKKQELADLEAFYQTVTPDAEGSAEGNVILPEGVASQTEIPINQESNTPESSIPMDEAGNPIYHQAEISDTLDALLDGSLTLEEVDQFVNNHISDAERRLTESGKKAPVMELDIEGYKARKKEWEEGRKPIEQEKSYWEDIKSKLQDARVKPGEEAAINLMRNTAPQSGEELAAQMLANGSIKLLQDDYRRETGGRISESRSLFGLFAGKDKGGVSIERAGEILMQADLENGSNFFDQNDPNAGRNAIIEVLSTARTRGDLINYIKNRREAKAEEIRQAEYNEYARWCEENYHLSPEDYEAYEDAVVRDFKEKLLTDEEQFELDSQMADEIQAIQEELEEIDAILAQNRTEKDENTEGNDESGGDVLREGGSEILQGEQSAQTGRSGEIEAGEPAGPGVDRANGVAQESAPGEIKPIGKGVFGDIYDQFRGKAKEAIKFLLRKRSGEAIGALHHKEVGDIDLVWGKEGTGKSNGFGLSKLAKFHPEVLDSLQDILDDMVVISRSANRVNLESKTHKAAVRLEWDGEKKNWLLTAFEKEKPTATDRTTDIGDTELQNDTAPLQTESSSTDKDSDSSRNTNDLSEKIADAEANRADGAAQEGAGDEAVGRRYADEAQQGPVPKLQGLSGEEADLLLSRMESAAEISSEKELTPETWAETFDENNFIATPIGSVKMGGNQITKFFEKKRTKEFGMVGPTLSNPDVIIGEASEAKDGNAERGSSFLFIKTFNRNGEKVKFYASITVKQDGMEVSVSSHYMNKNKVKRALQESSVLYIREALLSNSSEWRLAEHRDDVPDLLPTQESNASKNKDTHSFRNNSELSEKIADAEANTDINPTEAQKGAGNYKKGHVRVGTFDISIEQPKGSVRSGVDANGKKWETTMQNTYGYIRGTEGVDGDHIDVFLSDDIDGWNGRKAFVVDQYNEDGSFDEHKVMLGFNEAADAETAYFANYDKDWAKKHKTVVTPVNLEDFEKWIGSSHRKTKAFAEYKSVKTDSNKAQQELDKREAENNDNLRFRTAKESDVSSFAQKHQLEEADVKKYAESMKAGNLGGASYAFKSIKRSIRLANDQLSLGEFVKVFSPVKAELFDKFGNVDELRDSYVKQAQDERNAMEAARKREEEAAAAERKRLEEFELMSSEALDRAYLEAVEAQDESRMRDLVNEAARRKGYLSTDEFRMAHRAPSYDEEGIDKSMVDVAQNKDNIRDSLDEQFRMNRDKNREESIAAISEALDAIDKGEKPMVTIYRAVPKSLKEGSVRNGDWVTLSEAYARQHGNHALEGDYRMMEERVPAENLYWDGNDINEWGYDDKSDYLYKDTRNNRKLNDLVTRDDKGNIIPLSQRFNARKSDPRFRFIGEQGAARLDAAEEATTRLDNLNVAREMESAFNEKKQRIEKLRKSEPVEITGREIEPSDDLKQYKKNALEYGKRLRGEYTNKDTGETVMVGKNAIKEVLNHDYKNAEQLQSVAAIPQIIENAVYIESQANTDDKVDAEKFDYYVCGMKIGGEDYTVRAVIVTPKEGTRYYDHKLSKIEKGKLLDSLIGITTPGFNQTTSLNSDIKDTKSLSILQVNGRENARKIKLATGWERGVDGKWRYETPDFEYAPPENFEEGKNYSLSEILKDDELFAAYPRLKELKFRLESHPDEYGSGWFGSNEIVINTAHNRPWLYESTTAHEIQHAIQSYEGFEAGDHPEAVIDRYLDTQYKIDTADLNTLNTAAFIRKRAEKLIKRGKYKYMRWAVRSAMGPLYGRNNMYSDYGPIETLAVYHTSKELRDAYEKGHREGKSHLTGILSKKDAENIYMRNAGETEARNVSRRLSMTPEERRRTLAEETEDVAREDQLFLDDALGKPASYAPASGNIEEVNERFNEDLQRQIDGSLPKGHVYKLGNPSRFLQAAGFPYLPIELRADKLATKASEKYKSNHPFNLTSVENLPQAIANPIAVFDSKTRIDAKVVLTELESNGDNFVVAIQVNRKVGNIEINSVRSIYPKDYVKDIYSWINDGLLKWVDKKKATDFISNSSTPANVDDKNSSFSSATKIVESFVNPTLDEGKISSAVDELASGLHIPIHIIRDVNDITDDDKDTQRKKRGSKGWYDMETGEVYLVLPNAESIADAQATILHEVVAHKGLRGLLGEKFDDMMDSVYRNLPEDVRRKVTRAGLSRYGGDFRIATEEYLASVAENGVSEPSIWQKIKSAIRGFFRSLGIDLRMRDEDIAYMLWKSKNRLEKGDSLVTIIHKVAKDGNMRDTLLFRDPLVSSGTMLATSAEERRSMVRAIRSVIEGLKSASPSSRKFYQRFREGYQDRMIALREFQKEVEKETGHKIRDFENAYVYENTAQSKSQYDVEKFKETEFKKLVDEVSRLSTVDGHFDAQRNRDVENYMMIKHGLERNKKMREDELEKYRRRKEDKLERVKKEMEDYFTEKEKSGNYSSKQLENMRKTVDKRIEERENETSDLIEKKRMSLELKDFSGLTALSKEIFDSDMMEEQKLKDWAEKYENSHSTNGLWKAVEAATQATLEKMYQTNLIGREERDNLQNMYEYYIPLKEWDETTAGDLFDYFDADKDIVSNPIKKARGRKSRAGAVLANIAHDYESATMMGYKNLTKLRFANLVRNSKTKAAAVSNQWYVKSGVDAEGNPMWEAVSAEGLVEDPAENAKIINDFEEKMKDLREKGEAKTRREVLTLGVPVKDWQEKQHTVRVKEGGRDLLVYINGDPRVSQAINGLNNQNLNNSVLKALNRIRQFMMLNYTSRSVNFIIRNFVRDLFYTNTMNFVRYGAEFEGRYLKNIIPAIRCIARVSFGFEEKGAKAKQMRSSYETFLKGGGRTGFVAVMGYEKYKREVDRMVRKSAGGRLQVKDVFNMLGGYFETVNSIIENTSRFATYLAAKETGMSELQSISAAKEASVNFNRRGSGAMGAVCAQNFYFFFNAAVQGSHNFLGAAKANPGRASAAIAMWATLGFAYCMLTDLLLGDNDEYNEIPDYVRQNNVIIPVGEGKYVLLPLSVELRALYGLGDMSAQYLRGEYKGRSFTADVTGRMMTLLPFSFEAEGSDNWLETAIRVFTPDMFTPITDAYLWNQNFFGKRITGRNEFNKYVPEYHKVTTGTSKAIIKASERLNSLSGGDYASKGKLDYALLNPSAVEYLFEQYLGGVGKAIAQCYKTVEGAVTGDVQLRNIPVVSGLTYDTENMVPRNYTNERYNHYVKEYEEMQSRDRMYRKGLEGGKDLSGNYKSFANSRAYRRYQTTGFYKKAIESMYDMARLMDGEEKKALYEQARKTKEMMINELDKIGDE